SRTYNTCEFHALMSAEALKVTHAADIHFINSDFYGGYEDCIDILNSENITFVNCRFHLRPNGTTWQAATIKGGRQNISFDHVHITGKPAQFTFFDVGNHTIYEDRITHNIRFSNIVADEGTWSFSRTWNAKD